jgi:hypothetical protein
VVVVTVVVVGADEMRSARVLVRRGGGMRQGYEQGVRGAGQRGVKAGVSGFMVGRVGEVDVEER